LKNKSPPSRNSAGTSRQPSTAIYRQVQFQGPLPPPEILGQYERLHPGFAERLLAMAEREQANRQAIEKATNQANIILATNFDAQRKTGQYMAFFFGLVLIGASIYLALNGHDVVAGVLGGTTLIGALGLFLKNKQDSTDNTPTTPQA
jgi:uncharacterized membrane protein